MVNGREGKRERGELKREREQGTEIERPSKGESKRGGERVSVGESKKESWRETDQKKE